MKKTTIDKNYRYSYGWITTVATYSFILDIAM